MAARAHCPAPRRCAGSHRARGQAFHRTERAPQHHLSFAQEDSAGLEFPSPSFSLFFHLYLIFFPSTTQNTKQLGQDGIQGSEMTIYRCSSSYIYILAPLKCVFRFFFFLFFLFFFFFLLFFVFLEKLLSNLHMRTNKQKKLQTRNYRRVSKMHDCSGSGGRHRQRAWLQARDGHCAVSQGYLQVGVI